MKKWTKTGLLGLAATLSSGFAAYTSHDAWERCEDRLNEDTNYVEAQSLGSALGKLKMARSELQWRGTLSYGPPRSKGGKGYS